MSVGQPMIMGWETRCVRRQATHAVQDKVGGRVWNLGWSQIRDRVESPALVLCWQVLYSRLRRRGA